LRGIAKIKEANEEILKANKPELLKSEDRNFLEEISTKIIIKYYPWTVIKKIQLFKNISKGKGEYNEHNRTLGIKVSDICRLSGKRE